MLPIRHLIISALRTVFLRALLPILAVIVLVGLALYLTGCTPGQEVPGTDVPEEAPACACEAPAYQPAVYVANAHTTIHGWDDLVAMCDPGDIALSGGCMGNREDGEMATTQGAAQLDGTMSPVGWFCEFSPSSTGQPFRVVASATCLHVQD